MVEVFLFILIRLKLLLWLQKTATKVGLNSKNDILAPNLEVNNRDNIYLTNSRPTICGVNRPTRPIFRPILDLCLFFHLLTTKKLEVCFFLPAINVWGLAIGLVSGDR